VRRGSAPARFSVLLKRLVGRSLKSVQGIPAYRRIVKSFRPDVRIALADREDLRQVRAWFGRADQRRSVAQDPDVVRFVAKVGGRVVGFVLLARRPGADTPYAGNWLHSLRVSPPYRGMGIGEALTEAVIDRAQEEGAQELLLLVGEDNRAAIRLYRKLGFEQTLIPSLQGQLERNESASGRRMVAMRLSLVEDKT
jgi:ribosomal protein S18 acetylase RimI-like enzyme